MWEKIFNITIIMTSYHIWSDYEKVFFSPQSQKSLISSNLIGYMITHAVLTIALNTFSLSRDPKKQNEITTGLLGLTYFWRPAFKILHQWPLEYEYYLPICHSQGEQGSRRGGNRVVFWWRRPPEKPIVQGYPGNRTAGIAPKGIWICQRFEYRWDGQWPTRIPRRR